MSLIGIAHRTSYVMQGSVANVTHLLEGYIDGLNSRRPALFNIYTACMPEHGIGDDSATAQAKMALESRAYPAVRFDPDAGTTIKQCIDLEGNPAMDADWPTYQLKYVDEKDKEGKLDLPLTFADFAMTEGRFRKHFRKVPEDAWNDDMLPLAEFIDLEEDDREGLYPYIWAVDSKNRLMRVLVAQELVDSTIERRDFWHQLKSLAGIDEVVDVEEIANQAKTEMAQKLTSSLLALAGGGNMGALTDLAAMPSPGAGDGATQSAEAGDYEPVWVETPECTACDECTTIAPKAFAYNADKKAEVINPKGATFKDLVKAAEKCTAGCIHPGTPWNPNEKDLDKLLKRAAKYQ